MNTQPFFVLPDGRKADATTYSHPHEELAFEVSLQAGPVLKVELPLESDLRVEFLARLAQEAPQWDFFDNDTYISFEGADPDYAYTFAELIREAGQALESHQEDDCVIFRGRS